MVTFQLVAMLRAAAAATVILSALPTVPARAAKGDCAQPVSTGSTPVSSDCLFILRTSVGARTCAPTCICDTNGNSSTTASDALLCLRKAVGQPVTLACKCPAPAVCGNGIVEDSEPCDVFASPSGCAVGQQCSLGDSGCSCGPIPATIGKTVEFTAPPIPDPSSYGLPSRPDGTLLLTEAPHVELRLDPALADPVSAAARCSYWVGQCLSPPSRSLDDCVRSAPACQTQQPWNEAAPCCPSSCFTAYETLRKAGASDLLAWEQALFTDGSCIPGLRQQLGRG